MEGCGSCFARGFLIIFNIIFVLLGLGFVIAGAVFKFGTDLVKDEVSRVLDDIPTDIVDNVSLGSILNSLAIVFMAVGAIMLLVGLLGCCGACCKARPLLVGYAIVVSLVLIVQIVGIGLFFGLRPDFEKFVNKGFSKLFEQYKTPGSGSDAVKATSRSLDGLFSLMNCCGFNNSDDITKHAGWNIGNPTFMVPQGCCRKYDIGDQKTDTEDMLKCLKRPNSINSYEETGCYPKLESLISQYSDVFIGVGITVLIVELLCIMFAFCVCCDVSRDSMV
ncbi:hypothetical protein ScPMuIL_003053 [Solemya velum]